MKNGYFKKILTMLVGLNSICCCSAMEKEVLNPQQQIEHDKKFDLVDSRKMRGDMIPICDDIIEIFRKKISPLTVECYQKLLQNKSEDIIKNNPQTIIDIAVKRALMYAAKNGDKISRNISHHPLACSTYVKKCASSCQSYASAWIQFLGDLNAPVAAMLSPGHVNALTLIQVKDARGKKLIIPTLLDRKFRVPGIYVNLVLKQFDDEAFGKPTNSPLLTCNEHGVEYYGVYYEKTKRISGTLWTFLTSAKLNNFKTLEYNPSLQFRGYDEILSLKNDILSAAKRLQDTGKIINMPYIIRFIEGKGLFLHVYELDLYDVYFVENKKLNKEIQMDCYIIRIDGENTKNIKLNSKWKDIKAYFRYVGKSSLPKDISLWHMP